MPDRDAERLRQALTELADVQLALDAERLALHDIRSLFGEVLSAMTDAVAIADPAGRVRQLNPAAERLLGVVGNDVVGHPLSSIVSGAFPGSAWEVLQVSAPVDAGGVETLLRTPDGHEVPVSLSVSVIRDTHGKIAGVLYSARDLSETQRLLVAVRRAEERWRLLAAVGDSLAGASGPDALADTLALLHEPLSCNRSAVVVVGDGSLSVVASGIGEPLVTAADLPDTLQDPSALAAVISDGSTIIVDATGRTDYPMFARGSSTQLNGESYLLAPLRSDGATAGALVVTWPASRTIDSEIVEIIQTVAERIGAAVTTWRLRDSLLEASAAQAAARYREMIAAAVSHDMKTPLASLTGVVRALRSGPLDVDRAPRLFEVLERQSTRLGRLVYHLLDFARIESGHRLDVNLGLVDVDTVMSSVANHADRSISIGRGDPHLTVVADTERLEQVLGNLVTNAVKFSPLHSLIELSARRHGDEIHITVADCGSGIPPAQQARLFEPFRRGDHPEVTGAGLGLYLSRAITEAMGGRLDLVASSATGSTIRVALPAAGHTDHGE